jgi:hypothetical protein
MFPVCFVTHVPGCTLELGALANAYVCAYDAEVSFEWDEVKATSNLRKHRIEFADAVAVFDDGSAVTIPDEDSEDEERWVTIGPRCV